MKGFSPRNLNSMLSFAREWPDELILQQLVAKLPWGHNVALISKLKTQAEREWYAKAAVEYGWSRSVLVHQIDTKIIDRQGSAITNFSNTLPVQQSELAQQLIKDPYILDFMTLAVNSKERDLENGLIDHLKNFQQMNGGSVYPQQDRLLFALHKSCEYRVSRVM